MMKRLQTYMAALLLTALCGSVAAADARMQTPLAPFSPDAHTLLLYHFDEGSGAVAKDAGSHGYDGEVRAGQWTAGKFGGALAFNGKNTCVFRRATETIEKLRQFTVECWYQQENAEGRQFLVGKDVTFHFDLSAGAGTSLSLYNQEVKPSDPTRRRHHQLGASLGTIRMGRWHHVAATYDGAFVSFFLDGVLKRRLPAEKDYVLGGKSRGLWVGCYVGQDYWFSGKIDELRVSDCVRYDPQRRLADGQRAFTDQKRAAPAKAVRKLQSAGRARLCLSLVRRHGGSAAGWVYLKPPTQKAVIVGRYEVRESSGTTPVPLEFDVSDEMAGDGRYIVGLENTQGDGYFSLTAARLVDQKKAVATWTGDLRSRRTFSPPLLALLEAGRAVPTARSGPIVLLPQGIDRTGGGLEIDEEPGEMPCFYGQGMAEYWIDVPAEQTYRVSMRYAAPIQQPCDIIVDGRDLNAYTMCARNSTDTARQRDALWETQGTTKLSAGPHWIRIQDVLPEILALRLEPSARRPAADVPWQGYPVPDNGFLGSAGPWQSEPVLGSAKIDRSDTASRAGRASHSITASFANADQGQLFAGDAVRLVCRGQWDLGPFGKLKFRFLGQGTGHLIALWAIDRKGEEKLLWRTRDKKPGERQIEVPVSFEGNDVFDPAHVEALCWELDEGNVRSGEVNRFTVTIAEPVFCRRDRIEPAVGYEAAVARARAAMAAQPVATAASVPPWTAREFQPWTKPVVPEEHPQFAKSEPKPVTRKTLGYGMHTTGARGIRAETLDQFHKDYQFGDVCWPHIGICPRREAFKRPEQYQEALKAFEQQLVEVRDRGLFLFDIWGYVPYMAEFPWTIAPEHHEILLRVFGDRFLGYDNGEQDGRYIGAYAAKGTHTDRKQGWDDFVRWDEHVCRDSMNYMNATGSLNFSHYYGERNCRMLGLETAQGLPSDTLMFAFLRGAGRQYGRLTYQATSIWNRFGYNVYADRKTTGAKGYGFGPGKGCSTSLHRRLFFAGYLGGQSIFGTESSQFTADRLENGAFELSPLGRQHLELASWAAKHPDRGVPYAPVAFMLDFHNGWNMPRHLYRPDKYKIWGKFPYEKGDYLIDAMFRMVWPGYEDCSYLRNERGFLTATPYGDMFDVLTHRCHPQVLRQYAAVMLLGDVEMTPETVARLVDYVREGGELIVDARQARSLPGDLTGVRLAQRATGLLTRDLATGEVFVEQPYRCTVLHLEGASPLVTNEHGHPLLTLHTAGKGRVVVGAVDSWMTDPLQYGDPEIVNMEPPYRLLRGVQAVLGRYFDSLSPVRIDPPGLTLMTCCHDGDPKHLWIGLLNNDLFADWHGTLRLRRGSIAAATELWRGRPLAAQQQQRIELDIPAGDAAIIDLRLK